MSFARISDDSDVYVSRLTGIKGILCLGCPLPLSAEQARTHIDGPGLPNGWLLVDHLANDAWEMIAHLDEHRARGHRVPDRAYDALAGWAGRQHADMFASRLKAARERAGFSQNGLARRTGLLRGAIAHYESGKSTPRVWNLVILAKTLGVTTDYLLGLKETP